MYYSKKTNNDLSSKIFGGFVLVLIFVVFILALKVGLAKQAKVDCYKWQSYEKNYSLFEPSKEMLDQCNTLGIDIKN